MQWAKHSPNAVTQLAVDYSLTRLDNDQLVAVHWVGREKHYPITREPFREVAQCVKDLGESGMRA